MCQFEMVLIEFNLTITKGFNKTEAEPKRKVTCPQCVNRNEENSYIYRVFFSDIL